MCMARLLRARKNPDRPNRKSRQRIGAAPPSTIGAMDGTDAQTGKRLSGIAHLRQSIGDILTTPLGSRVMRRDYGSELFRLVDAPMNRATMVDVYAATAAALLRFEPRIKLQRVRVEAANPGRLVLERIGTYLPDGQPITLDGIVVT